jgi:hypothetical protein
MSASMPVALAVALRIEVDDVTGVSRNEPTSQLG